MVLSAWLVSCSTAPHVYTNTGHSQPPRYSLIFMIHGDANYVFHDTAGIVHKADEDVLAQAMVVARANPRAEVFIFHEKPLIKTLFFFKRHDGEFYYFRDGELMVNQQYWRDEGTSRFSVQGALYNAYRSKPDANGSQYPKRMFLYFGHEIPEVDNQHYDESYPDSTLTIKKFSNDLRSFSAQELDTAISQRGTDSKDFDLIVMSTCYNGSPHSVAALSSFTQYIMASPTNLHLSYIDLEPFKNLDQTLSNGSIGEFVNYAAQHSYHKLSSSVQTVIGISVYDVAAVEPYINSVDSLYSQMLTKMNMMTRTTGTHCDCADLAPFNSPLMYNGVHVLYRPPLFGHDAGKTQHSGWSCWTTMNIDQ